MRNPICVFILVLWSMCSPTWTDAQPYWRTENYETTTQPYWRPTWEKPYWNRRYWEATAPPYWRRRYWEATTPPYWRRNWEKPYWNRRYWEATAPTVVQDIPHPTLELYQQVKSKETLVVICQFGMNTRKSFFELSVKNSDEAYVMRNPDCNKEAVCVFNLTVTPPATFTCVHKVATPQGLMRHVSDPYTYNQTEVFGQQQLVGSPFYTGFACFIGAGLIVMVITVIVITLRRHYNG